MVGIRVKIEPTIINWVIENVPPEQTSPDIFDTLENWKEGAIRPTFKQLESISDKIHIPLGYFFLKTPPREELPVLEYRTVAGMAAKTPSRNLVDTVHYAENVQDWMRNYLIDSGADKLEFICKGKTPTDAGGLAKQIRNSLQLKINWYTDCKNANSSFKFIRTRLEGIGVLVLMNGVVGNNTRRKLDISEFRAFTLTDDFAPLIFINGNDSDGAKLFSLLHETVHIRLGIDGFFNERFGDNHHISDAERLCNAVAAELLVPNELFTVRWETLRNQTNSSKTIIYKLASEFHCGNTVIARRAKDTGYINVGVYNEIADEAMDRYNQYVKNRGGGGDFYRTAATRLDKRFLLAVAGSVGEGKTQYTDAYKLTNLNRTTFSKLLEQVKEGNQ
jgi:Zn-dependent peptidase ImmA (M78 family)